ncbi:MAG: glycosyltransferase family 2 protein [Ignavibacteriales bacterium]|nr:glycosyltransferase family 2 protein [Ignavibacteriales bacterium]
MYKKKTICVIVPAYNEETQIGKVITTMPAFVDKIVIIDDKSKDGTVKVVKGFKKNNDKIVFIQHEKNQGVGGAIATGYKWARDNEFDVAVVMAGDGQMDPDDLENVINPVVSGEVDFTKGNRLITGEAFKKIPKIRYFGNSILSFLTKIASGYWHVADSQSGYTAINKKALHMLNWDSMYKRYGQPNDLLVRLNIYNLCVRDVEVKPVYNIGEKSGIRIWKVIFTISLLLLKLFYWRLAAKYIIRDFHPLVFFYALGFFLITVSFLLGIRLLYFFFVFNTIPSMNSIAFLFTSVTGLQSIFFAMWFDMFYNSDLKGKKNGE